MNLASWAAAALGCASTACWGGATCLTNVASPALVVMVTDSSTGLPAAEGSFGSMVRFGQVERLIPFQSRGVPPDDTLISLAATPSSGGIYFVNVSRAGYVSWQRGDVHLSEGECGFATTTVTAKLQPAP